jgi:ABC-type Fe3+-hydroxamate transport system substrate-binding protein
MKKLYEVVAAVLVALALAAGMIVLVWPQDPPPREPKPVCYVSFSPGISEAIYAVGAGGLLKGVDSWSLTPKELADARARGEVETVGMYSQPNIEAVVRLNPSAIFMESTETVGSLWSLRNDDCDLHEISLITLPDILAAYRTIGRLVGKEAEGEALSTKIELELSKPAIVEPTPKVLLVIPWEPTGGTSCLGPPSYHSQILERLGGVNVLAGRDKAWVIVKSEEIAVMPVDLVIFVGPSQEGLTDDERNALILGSPALSNGDVRVLNIDTVLIKGPLSIGRYISEMRKLLTEWDAARRAKAG